MYSPDQAMNFKVLFFCFLFDLHVDKIRQLIMIKEAERSARTYTAGIPSTLWSQMCMSETIISLGQQENKILSEMQDRPTTTHYSTSSSTNKQETMRFLNKQCFFLL